MAPSAAKELKKLKQTAMPMKEIFKYFYYVGYFTAAWIALYVFVRLLVPRKRTNMFCIRTVSFVHGCAATVLTSLCTEIFAPMNWDLTFSNPNSASQMMALSFSVSYCIFKCFLSLYIEDDAVSSVQTVLQLIALSNAASEGRCGTEAVAVLFLTELPVPSLNAYRLLKELKQIGAEQAFLYELVGSIVFVMCRVVLFGYTVMCIQNSETTSKGVQTGASLMLLANVVQVSMVVGEKLGYKLEAKPTGGYTFNMNVREGMKEAGMGKGGSPGGSPGKDQPGGAGWAENKKKPLMNFEQFLKHEQLKEQKMKAMKILQEEQRRAAKEAAKAKGS